jgi:hypothetical protein
MEHRGSLTYCLIQSLKGGFVYIKIYSKGGYAYISPIVSVIERLRNDIRFKELNNGAWNCSVKAEQIMPIQSSANKYRNILYLFRKKPLGDLWSTKLEKYKQFQKNRRNI